MARQYGRFTTDIWDDPKFRALSAAAQRVYLMLGTQADITAAGTLALRLRRWSRYACDTTSDALSDALSELSEKRFVVIDEDTEELLVRSFVKWDGGINNEKRRPVVIDAAMSVESPTIRAVLAQELTDLGFPDALPDSPSDATSGFDRVVVTKGEYGPQPSTPSPQPATRVPVAREPSATPTAQTLLAEWIDHCAKRPPGNVVGQVGKIATQLLAEGIDPDDIRRGLAAWASKGLHPSTLPSVVNEVMNAPIRGRPNGRSTTDDRVNQALALAEHFEALEPRRKAIT